MSILNRQWFTINEVSGSTPPGTEHERITYSDLFGQIDKNPELSQVVFDHLLKTIPDAESALLQGVIGIPDATYDMLKNRAIADMSGLSDSAKNALAGVEVAEVPTDKSQLTFDKPIIDGLIARLYKDMDPDIRNYIISSQIPGTIKLVLAHTIINHHRELVGTAPVYKISIYGKPNIPFDFKYQSNIILQLEKHVGKRQLGVVIDNIKWHLNAIMKSAGETEPFVQGDDPEPPVQPMSAEFIINKLEEVSLTPAGAMYLFNLLSAHITESSALAKYPISQDEKDNIDKIINDLIDSHPDDKGKQAVIAEIKRWLSSKDEFSHIFVPGEGPQWYVDNVRISDDFDIKNLKPGEIFRDDETGIEWRIGDSNYYEFLLPGETEWKRHTASVESKPDAHSTLYASHKPRLGPGWQQVSESDTSKYMD